MKILKKVLIVLLLVLIIGVAGVFLIVKNIAKNSIPNYTESVKLKGIEQGVTVYRDSFAIPHIYAKTEKDLYKAVGYLTAQDRLWQLDLLRRVTTGKLSEIFGKDFVKSDKLLRALRIPEKSKRVIQQTDKEILSLLQAFSEGVNIFIENNKNKLPIEFIILGSKPEKWIPEYSVNLIGYMAWDLTMPWDAEVEYYKISKKVSREKFLELIPDLELHENSIYKKGIYDTTEIAIKESLTLINEKLEEIGLGVFHGSNNWAVSGKKSTTGKPILSNDMHLGLSIPGIWMQMHQVVENKLNVTGLVLPGQPFVIAGHNEKIAWGLTNVMLDDMDFYIEKINQENNKQYLFNGEWRDLKIVNEKINIKGEDPVEVQNIFTHRGPIISDIKGVQNQSISMCWSGNNYSNELRSIYKFNRCSNWNEFKEAAKTFLSVSQNIIYADIEGNIGLYCCAGVPIRKGNGIFINSGETDEFDWTGFVPFDSLPHQYNPECGFLASANNKTVDDSYPYYISHWFDFPHRFDRITELLNAKEKLSTDDFQEILADHKSKLVESMLSKVVTALQNFESLNETEKQALNLLSDWNGILTANSPEALIFENLYVQIVKNIFKDELGDELLKKFIKQDILPGNLILKLLNNKTSQWCDNIKTKNNIETFSDIIQISFKEVISDLSRKYSKNVTEWQWGDEHKLLLAHPLSKVKIIDKLFGLNRGPYPIGGSFHTVSPFSYDFTKDFIANHGSSHRHIFTLADWDASLTVIPTGNCGVPASPHYCDQTELYINYKYHKDYFSKKLVESNYKYKMNFLSE